MEEERCFGMKGCEPLMRKLPRVRRILVTWGSKVLSLQKTIVLRMKVRGRGLERFFVVQLILRGVGSSR